jgi:hypothetical protein
MVWHQSFGRGRRFSTSFSNSSSKQSPTRANRSGPIEIVTVQPPRETPTAHADERRDLRLDACRGLAQWFIFVDHVPNNVFAWLTLRNYGFSDTTEVFVFVSGYTCMLAYGGAWREQGWPVMATRAWRRGWEIYAAFLLLVIVYLALIWVAGGGSHYLDETNTKFFFENPGAALLHVLTLQYTPVDTDILPTFALLHLVFPLLLMLLHRSAATALGLSFLLYLMVQIESWRIPAWPSGELYFNPMAWQVLFVLGAWYAAGGAVRLNRLIRSPAVVISAIAFLAFSLLVALSWQIEPLKRFVPDAVSLIYPVDKSHLAPVRLAHFLALAIVVSRLMPRDWRGLMKPLAIATIRCGEHSLAIYCFGVLLSFAGHVALVEWSDTIAVQFAITVGGIALMILAADLMTRVFKLDRHGPKLF